MVKEKGKSLMAKEVDVVLEDKEQGKMKKSQGLRWLSPIDRWSLSPNLLQRPSLRPSLENS